VYNGKSVYEGSFAQIIRLIGEISGGMMNKRGFTLIELLLVIFIVITFATLFRGVFVDSDEAVRALQTQGYSDIKITDKAIFFISLRGGSREDAAMFTAHAKNPVGKEVIVYVCVGWPFKGATIRTK